ncbi:hypothetical protein SLA2020_435200 [Shorea laevis]
MERGAARTALPASVQASYGGCVPPREKRERDGGRAQPATLVMVTLPVTVPFYHSTSSTLGKASKFPFCAEFPASTNFPCPVHPEIC